MDNYKLAEIDYSDGMKYKDIAAKYDVSINTVKSWKKRHEWFRGRGAHKDKGVHTKRGGAMPGNSHAKGNKGNKEATAPKGNDNATVHGLYAKHLPDGLKELMNVVEQQSPVDMLWQQIVIQYTTIIRSQEIMWVSDSSDDLEKESSWSSGEGGSSSSTKLMYAYERQESFIKAQSRAMTTLSGLIKQFVSFTDEQDERRAKLQLMQAQVAKVESETKANPTQTTYIVDDLEDLEVLDEEGN